MNNKILKKAAAIILAGAMTASAVGTAAFAEKAVEIESVTVDYAAVVAKPTIMIKGGEGYRQIRLSDSTSGASIYYTTNGANPKISGKKYKAGTLIKITAGKTIKAVAVKDGKYSTVLSKVIDVETVYGDVTGDGSVGSADYTRLKKYLAGSTSYICKDNADVNGDGKITNADLTLIKKYNEGKIDIFPAEEIEEVSTPIVRTYEYADGTKLLVECDDNVYYTTDGTTPTKNSKRYTGIISATKSTTYKFVAYKDGEYSSVITKIISVSKCADVTADKSTGTNYTEPVSVKLSSRTSNSVIVYTTDGTDPKTSRTAVRYTGPVYVSANTTIKAYACADGCRDGDVTTFNYRVTQNSFTITGTVWDDTPYSTSSADGIRSSNEPGLNGIKVYLYDENTGRNVASTTTSTINGNAGSYEFKNITNGHYYSVVFEYNGMKYNAYDRVVYGGNQAVPTSSSDFPMTVMNSGAYDSYGRKITSVNNYKDAVNSSVFTTTAKSSSKYSSSVNNVNLALNTNNYGNLFLTMRSTTGRSEVSTGDYVSYEVVLSNRSQKALKDASVIVYVDKDLEDIEFSCYGYYINYSVIGSDSTYTYYLVSDFVSRGLSSGSSATINLTAKVKKSITSDTILINSAEVYEYTHLSAAYTMDSVPGNMGTHIGTAREADETVSDTIRVKAEKPASTLSIDNKDIYIMVTKYTFGNVISYCYNMRGRDELGNPQVHAIIKNAGDNDTIIATLNGTSYCNVDVQPLTVMGQTDKNFDIFIQPYGYFDSDYIPDDIITVYPTSNPGASQTIRVHYIVVDELGFDEFVD